MFNSSFNYLNSSAMLTIRAEDCVGNLRGIHKNCVQTGASAGSGAWVQGQNLVPVLAQHAQILRWALKKSCVHTGVQEQCLGTQREHTAYSKIDTVYSLTCLDIVQTDLL